MMDEKTAARCQRNFFEYSPPSCSVSCRSYSCACLLHFILLLFKSLLFLWEITPTN